MELSKTQAKVIVKDPKKSEISLDACQRKEVSIENGMSALSLNNFPGSSQQKCNTQNDVKSESLLAQSKIKNEMIQHSSELLKSYTKSIESLHEIIRSKDKEIASLKSFIEGSDGKRLANFREKLKKEVEGLTFELRQEETNMQIQTSVQLGMQQRVYKIHLETVKSGQKLVEKVCKDLIKK